MEVAIENEQHDLSKEVERRKKRDDDFDELLDHEGSVVVSSQRKQLCIGSINQKTTCTCIHDLRVAMIARDHSKYCVAVPTTNETTEKAWKCLRRTGLSMKFTIDGKVGESSSLAS